MKKKELKENEKYFLLLGRKYGGQYVATVSFYDYKVISHGTDIKIVRENAQKMGCEDPLIFYIPQQNK